MKNVQYPCWSKVDAIYWSQTTATSPAGTTHTKIWNKGEKYEYSKMKLLENNWVLLFQFERKFPRCNFTFTPHNLLFGLTRAICSILCKCAFASMRMFKQSNYCRWSLKSSNCECKPTFKTVQAEIPDILTKYLISIPKSVISESKFAHKCGW